MKTVNVVAAVIVREGKVFATQRGYGPWKGWWEFPGGKVEQDETPADALIREIKEELDTLISVEGFLRQVEWDYPDFHLSMGCYLCHIQSGSLELREHQSAAWLDASDIYDVKWLPADLDILPDVLEALN